MALVERAGKYAGYVTDGAVSETESGCIQYVAACSVYSIWDEERRESVDIEPPQYIMAYLILTKKDGSKNESQVSALGKALGWNGKSLRDLNDADFSGREVWLTVSESEYNGKIILSVDWINPPGGVRKATESELDAMSKKWSDFDSHNDEEGSGSVDSEASIPF